MPKTGLAGKCVCSMMRPAAVVSPSLARMHQLGDEFLQCGQFPFQSQDAPLLLLDLLIQPLDRRQRHAIGHDRMVPTHTVGETGIAAAADEPAHYTVADHISPVAADERGRADGAIHRQGRAASNQQIPISAWANPSAGTMQLSHGWNTDEGRMDD